MKYFIVLLLPALAFSASPLFAPYVDVNLDQGIDIRDVMAKTGQKDFTLAFALGSHEGCVPKWGAMNDIDDPTILTRIKEVQSAGGQMVVATGGAMGPYLEHLCGTSDALTEAYLRILDVVGTNHLDVDVEAPINNEMVCTALAKVQQLRPGTTVSFTLMVQGDDYGLTPELGVKVLLAAKAAGVEVSIVNAMTMEYPSSLPSWGDSVIRAAEMVLVQMKEIWPEKSDAELRKMLGVTPMLGRNFSGKIFEVSHARQLVDYANENKIGHLSFWSIGRDNGACPGGAISPICSGLAQEELEFTQVYRGFRG